MNRISDKISSIIKKQCNAYDIENILIKQNQQRRMMISLNNKSVSVFLVTEEIPMN